MVHSIPLISPPESVNSSYKNTLYEMLRESERERQERSRRRARRSRYRDCNDGYDSSSSSSSLSSRSGKSGGHASGWNRDPYGVGSKVRGGGPGEAGRGKEKGWKEKERRRINRDSRRNPPCSSCGLQCTNHHRVKTVHACDECLLSCHVTRSFVWRDSSYCRHVLPPVRHSSENLSEVS